MDIKVEPSDYKSSSKFADDPLTEALWVCSLDSGQDEEAGTTEDIGWHALFHFDNSDTIRIDDGYVTESESSEPIDVTVPRGSYILMQISSGAVYSKSYPLRGSEVSEEWRKILAAESDLYDEETGDHNYAD